MDGAELLRREIDRREGSSTTKCAKCGRTSGTFMRRPTQSGGMQTLCDECLSGNVRSDFDGLIDNDPMLGGMGKVMKQMLDQQQGND